MKIYMLALCLILSINCAHAQKNLVSNGGFEHDMDDWNGDGAKISPWDFKNGKNSCAIITSTTDNWVGIDQIVPITKKVQAIEFSVWLKAEHIVKGKDPWNGALFIIQFLDTQDKKIGDDINIVTIAGDDPWNLHTKKLKVPDAAISFKILLAMGYANGVMLIDDVSTVAINTEDLGK